MVLVKVNGPNDEKPLKMKVSSGCTFEQIRQSAAKHWNLDTAAHHLVDRDGCECEDLAVVQQDVELNLTASSQKIEQVLWHIFTYYCVHGDACDIDSLHNTQWAHFVRDASVDLDSTLIDVIFVQSKSRVSGRLDFESFLNALVALSDQMNMSFREFVLDIVIPQVKQWTICDWKPAAVQSEKIFRYFEKPLFQIFKFYTESIFSATNPFSITWTFEDFSKFSRDFQLIKLQLTNRQVAELFLMSCYCTQRESRTRLYFKGFVDLIRRIASVAMPRLYQSTPMHCSKALLQHLNRSLSRSRVMEIVSHREAKYPAELLAGSISFSSKFMKMWRKDGCPDYLTGKGTKETASESRGLDLVRQLDVKASIVWPVEVAELVPAKVHVVKEKENEKTEESREEFLMKGSVFKKYGQWGKQQRRRVWWNKETNQLCWQGLKSEKQNHMDVGDILQVLSADSVLVASHYQKYVKTQETLDYCFSILGRKQHLALQAESIGVRNQWIDAMRYLISS